MMKTLNSLMKRYNHWRLHVLAVILMPIGLFLMIDGIGNIILAFDLPPNLETKTLIFNCGLWEALFGSLLLFGTATVSRNCSALSTREKVLESAYYFLDRDLKHDTLKPGHWVDPILFTNPDTAARYDELDHQRVVTLSKVG